MHYWRQIYRLQSKQQRTFYCNLLYIRRVFNNRRIENYSVKKLQRLKHLSARHAHLIIKEAIDLGLAEMQGDHLIFKNQRKYVGRWLQTKLGRSNVRIRGSKYISPKEIEQQLILYSLHEVHDRQLYRKTQQATNSTNRNLQKHIRSSVRKKFRFEISVRYLARIWKVGIATVQAYLDKLKSAKKVKIEINFILLQRNVGYMPNYCLLPGQFISKGNLVQRESMRLSFYNRNGTLTSGKPFFSAV